MCLRRNLFNGPQAASSMTNLMGSPTHIPKGGRRNNENEIKSMPREGKSEKKKAFLSTWKIGAKEREGEGGRGRERKEREREREREGGREREREREREGEGGREREREERERERERERGREREGEREGERGRREREGSLTIESHYIRMIKHCHSISFSQYLRLLIR